MRKREEGINIDLKLVSNVRNKQKHLKLLSGTVTTILPGHYNPSTADKAVGYMMFLHKKEEKLPKSNNNNVVSFCIVKQVCYQLKLKFWFT